MPSLLAGRYVVGRRLGAGAFGVVYQAHDQVLKIDVALKRMRKREGSALLRFKHEFRRLADIVHPNLVRLHELFVSVRRLPSLTAAGGRCYLVGGWSSSKPSV